MRGEEKIKLAIEKVLEEMGLVDLNFTVEHPKNESFGDFSTNAAIIAKLSAEEVKLALEQDGDLMKLIERLEIAGVGFINFWLKKEFLITELGKVIAKKDDYGKGEWGKGKKVLVEYSSPNIAKNFSVGHLRSTIIGQTIKNLYDFSGWQTVSDNHLGDWGTQFGMMIAVIEEKDLDKKGELEKMTVEELEALYVEFNQKVKEDESLRETAKKAFLRLEQGEARAKNIWQKLVDVSLEEFERIYKRLKVSLDYAHGESSYIEEVKEVLKEAREQHFAFESEGALVMELGEGLPVGMLLKSDSATTYFLRDLATIRFRNRNEDLKSDLYVYEVGAEQALYFKQLFKAAEILGYGKVSDFVHVGHGLILGSDGKKMSTRKGTGIRMEEWLNEAVERAIKIAEERKAEPADKKQLVPVGIGAVKFFDLRHTPETSYKFDLNEALRLDGFSGPYIQYAFVRANKIIKTIQGVTLLAKKAEAPAKASSQGHTLNMDSPLNTEEANLLRWIYRFGETVEASAKQFNPCILTEYVYELAKRFNNFYEKNPILEGGESREFRLALTGAVAQVIKNGLTLLGIEVVEKM